MRWLDRYPGWLLCLVLTGFRRLGNLFRPASRYRHEPSKFLFIKLIEQGATVHAQEAVRRVADRVGRENVFFCVFAENRGILDLLDLVPRDNVIPIETGGPFRMALDLVRALVRFRREGIDTTIDMEFMTRAPAVIAYLSGARRRVGLHRFTSEAPYRGDLMTDRVQHNPYHHVSEAYALLVESLYAPAGQVPLPKIPMAEVEARHPRFELTAEDSARGRALLEAEAGTEVKGAVVLLNPNASDLLPLRKWDAERFVELGRRLLAVPDGATIALTGAPSERAAAEALARRIGSPPRVISLAGKTTLRDLLAVYSIADVLVTNDSGPGHFASMTDIHNIVIFGPASPQVWGPRGGRSHVLWAQLACSPCVSVYNHRRSPCADNICMQNITVDQVYERVLHCLEEPRPPCGTVSSPGEPTDHGVPA
jgi:ADP-heptose:LPS heptosyltransferase